MEKEKQHVCRAGSGLNPHLIKNKSINYEWREFVGKDKTTKGHEKRPKGKNLTTNNAK